MGVSAIDLNVATATLSHWIETGQRDYVVVCPVYTLMRSAEEKDLRRITNQAGLVTPDGMPIVFLSRMLGHKQVGRVYGPDLLLAMAAEGYSHYFYGGAPGVAAELADVLQVQFPQMQVAGAYSPPFRNLTPDEDRAIVERINAAQPDIIWVGLGSPKQDRWMAAHRAQLEAPVLVGVGAAFDFLTGRVRQAPAWMQRTALEWLFRLIQEPRRLWRRYIVYNPRFLYRALLQVSGLRPPPPIE